MKSIGVDALSFYVPQLYVAIEELAGYRDIPYPKLNKGLGLEKMAVPDVNEDAASFAANALIKLFNDYDINPNHIGRIYLGTESALDASKPTATYAVEVLEKELANVYGERSLKNCDVVDMTFACVGAVDALHNSLDWVNNGEQRQAIVVASDLSKYELNSTGEYTQGAGAVALLIKEDPSILTIDNVWGVATKSEGDFFKPRRVYKKKELIQDLIKELNLSTSVEEINQLLQHSKSTFWSNQNESVELFKEEPVFDGQFSNMCYTERMNEAFEHFDAQKSTDYLTDWDYFIFHLPYAFHGRRMIFQNWFNWIKDTEIYNALIREIGAPADDYKSWLKTASKSEVYRQFVNYKIAKGERASSLIGNMYTASIFMSFLSLLAQSLEHDVDLIDKTVGFIGYGSGSKSKIFQGTIQKNWKQKASKFELFKILNNRTKIDVATYEKLHKSQITEPILKTQNVKMSHVENEKTNQGLRRYSTQ